VKAVISVLSVQLINVYPVWQKSSALEFFAVFSGLSWNFKTKLYTLM